MSKATRTKSTPYRFSYVESYAKASYQPREFGPSSSQTWNRVFGSSMNTVQYVPYDNDRHKQKIAAGIGVTSTLIGRRFRIKAKPVTSMVLTTYQGSPGVSYIQTTMPWVGGGNIPSSTNSGAAPVGLASAIAAENLVSDYYAKRSAFQGGKVLAEGLQTIRGLASPAKALRKEVGQLAASLKKNLYRSSGRQGADLARVVGGTWLEWKFAVDPLIGDANDAADAFNRVSQGDFRHHIPIKGIGVSGSYSDLGYTPCAVAGIPACCSVRCERVDRCLVINRASIRNTSNEVPLAWQFGVGVQDVLPAIVEAIPWSWFVDYFVNVSSVIEAFSIRGAAISWSNQTVRNSRTTGFAGARPFLATPTRTYSVLAPGGCSAECSFVTRTATRWKDLMPPLRFSLPGTSGKWKNLAGLATQYNEAIEAQRTFVDRRGRIRPRRPRY